MTAADQIRALADTGTPGPWDVDYLPPFGGAIIDHVQEQEPYRSVAYDIGNGADAAKIVAAVNALPKVADYDEAVMAYLNHQTVCGVGSSCPELVALWQALVVARGVLVAALGVTA